MAKLKSSSEDPHENTSTVLSRIWKVVWFIVKWGFRIAFGLVFGVIAFAFALGGVRLPKLDWDFDPRPDPAIDPDIEPNREWEKDKEKTSDEIIEEIRNIEPSTSEESRIFQKLQNSRGKRLKDISLSKKEWITLLILLLRARRKRSS
jgi:hypothetical protein